MELGSWCTGPHKFCCPRPWGLGAARVRAPCHLTWPHQPLWSPGLRLASVWGLGHPFFPKLWGQGPSWFRDAIGPTRQGRACAGWSPRSSSLYLTPIFQGIIVSVLLLQEPLGPLWTCQGAPWKGHLSPCPQCPSEWLHIALRSCPLWCPIGLALAYGVPSLSQHWSRMAQLCSPGTVGIT